jgi:hypothetical protein
MDELRVRVYNVLFGDAILVSVPDRGEDGSTTLRHILIDVGNSLNKAGGKNDVFLPVVKNILQELDGEGLDLYVMTHEHMDHVKGLLYANRLPDFNGKLKDLLGVKHAWLTGSSAPGYFDDHPQAQEKHLQRAELVRTLTDYLAACPDELSLSMQTLLDINDLAGTSECVDYLRNLAPEGCTHYVFRGIDLKGMHEFSETRFDIWAPEEDTSAYYARYHPIALNVIPAVRPQGRRKLVPSRIVDPIPPQGVDASAFYNLVEMRKQGVSENLMEIDKAENNTSVVFSLEWRGWRLLFAADAELRSWQIMQRENAFKPVDFLKVGHHGSKNATPPEDLLVCILPDEYERERKAAVSTFDHGQYAGVPDPDTLKRVKARCTLYDTEDLAAGEYYDITFAG